MQAAQRLLTCDLALRNESYAMEPLVPFGATVYGEAFNFTEIENGCYGDVVFALQTKDNTVTIGTLYFGANANPETFRVYFENHKFIELLKSDVVRVWRVLFIEPKYDYPPVWKVSA